MATATMTVDIDETNEKLLDALRDGARTPGWLLDNLELSVSTRSAVQQRLKLLTAADEVENIGHGLYQLPGGYVPREEAEESPVKLGEGARKRVGQIDEFSRNIAVTEERLDALARVYEYMVDRVCVTKAELEDVVFPQEQYNPDDLAWSSWYEGMVASLQKLPELESPAESDLDFWHYRPDKLAES